MIDSRYTFERLEIGTSNEEAISKCKEICKSPRTFSGLWMFGPSGCGKTHLLKATYNKLNQRVPRLKGLYVTAQELTELFCDFLNGESKLWVSVKSYDYLLIDNVEDLLGKPETQEVIAELITELSFYNKPVFLTSLCHPDELQNMKTALKAYNICLPFVEIKSADYNMKKAVADDFILRKSLNISNEECELLITSTKHISQLKMALISLKYFCESKTVDLEWLKQHGFMVIDEKGGFKDA